MKTQALITAAGMGRRLGFDEAKALVPVSGRSILERTLLRVGQVPGLLSPIIVTAPEEQLVEFDAALCDRGLPVYRLVAGGAERQDSVRLGLAATDPDVDIVVIHDAARPFVPVASVLASIEAATDCGAATVAIPAIDTILEGDEDAWLVSTPPRERMWACQTPQTFRRKVIMEAHARAQAEGHLGTDDASLVRRLGGTVKLVMGAPENIKITTPLDLKVAEVLAGEE